MYTEDEAREKWCPHVRYEDEDTGVSGNTWGNRPLNPANTCIGSACMAWRWKPLSQADDNTIRRYARDTSREMAEKKFQHQRQGYCGLSGSPSMGVK